MQVVRYKRGSMIGNAIGCVGIAVLGGWIAMTFEGAWVVFGLFLAIVLPFVAVSLVMRAMGDRIAIRFDDKSLYVSTLFQARDFSWSQIKSVHRETLRRSSAFGLIKQDLAHYLVFTMAGGGMFEKKLRVQEDLLDWPKGAMDALLDDLARAGRLGSAVAQSRQDKKILRRDPLEGAPRTDDFDPDAAIARYMATRDAAPPSAPRPGFGRKIV